MNFDREQTIRGMIMASRRAALLARIARQRELDPNRVPFPDSKRVLLERIAARGDTGLLTDREGYPHGAPYRKLQRKGYVTLTRQMLGWGGVHGHVRGNIYLLTDKGRDYLKRVAK